MKKNFLLLAICVSLSGMGLAQDAAAPAAAPAPKNEKFPAPKSFNSWSVGVNLGRTVLFGDIEPKKAGQWRTGLGYGFSLSKAFTHSFALKGDIFMGSLKSKSKGQNYDASSNTIVHYQYTLSTVFTFGNISYLKRAMPKMNFYVSAGIGHINFTPYDYKKVHSNWNTTTELVTPMAIGAKYKLGKHFTSSLEFNLVKTFSDKVDNHKVPLTQNDKYVYINAGLTYTFGKKEKSLEWVNPMEELYTEMSSIRNKMDSLIGDKDKDGVADLYDKDNATPAGVKVYGDGTSSDTDGDGVADASDADAFSARGSKVDATGKEMDTDGDGVYDSRDLEPATEKGKLVNFQGITIKVSDSGGVAGYEKYLPLVFFEFNKSNVKEQYHEGLASLARIMNASPNAKAYLFGNCDVVGTEAANTKLGQARAEAVRDYLVNVYGFDAGRFICESKGKNEPFSNKANKKDKDPLNRRVDYKIQ